jgi:hypothetical protein
MHRDHQTSDDPRHQRDGQQRKAVERNQPASVRANPRSAPRKHLREVNSAALPTQKAAAMIAIAAGV